MRTKPTGKGLAAIYRQELIADVTLFTAQSSATFYGRLFDTLDYDLPRARTGRKGFPKEALLNAFIVSACEGFRYVTDLWDYLNNNRLIAHYCGFDITRPLPSYCTLDRFLKKLNNGELKEVMFYWGYNDHILVDCISGLPLYELTTTAEVADSTVVETVLENANRVIPLKERTFIGDKGYDARHVYSTVKDVYKGEAVIPLNKRNTRDLAKLPSGVPICEASLAMHKDGKTKDNGRTRQKFCCPFRQSKTGECPCNHKNWNNGKKNRGCTKYQTISGDYRLAIDRQCLYFKRIYALRTECERYNSRFKATGRERLWVRNGSSAANLNTIAHISALAVAYAAVLSGSHHSYRSRKSLRRAG